MQTRNVDAMPTSSKLAPTDDEVAAIMSAVEVLWPTPTVNGPAEPTRNTAWRFSGRWWSRPVTARRDRPYR